MATPQPNQPNNGPELSHQFEADAEALGAAVDIALYSFPGAIEIIPAQPNRFTGGWSGQGEKMTLYPDETTPRSTIQLMAMGRSGEDRKLEAGGGVRITYKPAHGKSKEFQVTGGYGDRNALKFFPNPVDKRLLSAGSPTPEEYTEMTTLLHNATPNRPKGMAGRSAAHIGKLARRGK